MSINISYSIFADKAIVEAESHKPSLIGIFNVAHRKELFVLPTVAFYFVGHGTSGEHELIVKVVSIDKASEQSLAELPVKVIIPPKENDFSYTANMIGLPLLGQQLKFSIYQNDKLIHDNSIKIL